MSSEPNIQLHASRKQLLYGTLAALAIAALLLVVVILPAEYGKDPTRLGGLLGLTTLGEGKAVAAQLGNQPVMHVHERKPYNAKLEIALKGGEELEYKANLAHGEPMFYAWRVAGGPVHSEFHGEPTEGKWPKGFFQSYELVKSSSEAQGSFVAPFTGVHGWYWKNLSAEPATITLEVTGYYRRLGRIESRAAVTE
jgi:hypothetical protein